MLEYVFFDERPFTMFLDFLKGLGLAPQVKRDEEIFQASLPDDLDDDLTDRIEIEYDRLLDLNRELFYGENEAGRKNFHMASLILHLKDGRTSLVDVAPPILSKILEALTLEEWTALVASIVAGVETPDERTFCQRVRAGDVDFE